MQNDSPHVEMLQRNSITQAFLQHGVQLQTGYGAAPHTVEISGCAILAVDCYCIVKGFPLPDGDEMNDRIRFTEEMTDNRAINIIQVFLNRIQTEKFYDLTIINALDLNGNVAYGTVMSAVWRMVIEQENLYEWNKQEKVEEYLEKYGIEKARIKSIFGSKTTFILDQVHWLVDSSKPNVVLSPINLKVFREKFEMLFLTTNLHPSRSEEPRWEDSVEFADALRRAFRFEMNADEPCGMFMAQVFTTHFFSKRPQAGQGSIEMICENALRRFADNGLPAFDNQKSGVLLFVKKDAENDTPEKLHPLKLIVKELRKESNGTIETIQIRWLNPAVKTADIFEVTVEEYGQETTMRVKFDSPKHTHSDSLEKETGEPNETHDA